MKGLRSILIGCLALLVFPAAVAVDSDDTARAAVRRGTTSGTPTNVRQNSQTTKTNSGTRGGRSANATTTPGARDHNVASGRNTATQPKAKVTPRNTTGTRTVSERAPTKEPTRKAAPKTSTGIVARTATTKAQTTRSPKPTTRTTAGKQRVSRAAMENNGVVGGVSAKYSQCRQTFYDCMDEFCANKDTQLKRCACSSRYSEFDKAKKQLSKIEEKMLDFNQRLLTVNMDAEDVEAMLKSTEGEDAFYDTKDKTKSKKMLDEISKKLNTVFGDDQTNGMNAINLSLNTESAFDSIDSFAGSSTTTKSGVALYRAALPVCREMVLENCSETELGLAESGYQMLIEQDCNTVSKAYQSKNDEARTKVKESSALLDISRLDIHQKRNSDDLLTCKKKMLDMLTDSTVCGDNLMKCLDPSGQYIDPSTGNAVLTLNLANFSTLITRPGENETWTGAGTNAKFVTYLNDKKLYLEPAMENCQDIADNVWKQFIPDALAQIKIAQDAKMEEIRRACTTLTTECISNAAESITNFDARALSVFGVSADKTANTMCDTVKKSCAALLADSTTTTNPNAVGEWDAGMSDLATQKTYDTIISSCTQVGRNCIVQTCKSISGNFTLCENIDTSPNRHSILNRTACWNEVMDCVGSAGDLALNDIMLLMGKISQNVVPRTRANQTTSVYPERTSFYGEMYGTADQLLSSLNLGQSEETPNAADHIYDFCKADGNPCFGVTDTQSPTAECLKCRIAERIWGNCESSPNSSNETNRILKPLDSTETLLYWFAENTNTATGSNYARSCVNTRCSGNAVFYPNGSVHCGVVSGDNNESEATNGDHRYCPSNPDNSFPSIYFQRMNTPGGGNISNCCWSRRRTSPGTFWNERYNNNQDYIEKARWYLGADTPEVRANYQATVCPGNSCTTPPISAEGVIWGPRPTSTTNNTNMPNPSYLPYQVYAAFGYNQWSYDWTQYLGNINLKREDLGPNEWGRGNNYEDLIGASLQYTTDGNNADVTGVLSSNNICCATGSTKSYGDREFCMPQNVYTYKVLAKSDNGDVLLCIMIDNTASKNAWYCEGTDRTSNGECHEHPENYNDNTTQGYPHGKNVDCPGTLLYINKANFYQIATKNNHPVPDTQYSPGHVCGQEYTPKNFYFSDGSTETPIQIENTIDVTGLGWFVSVEKAAHTTSNPTQCTSYSNRSNSSSTPGNNGNPSNTGTH